ncbi:MAG: hypothetical protein AAF585_22825 [Verrucomicrobiota bacterium]
MIKIYRYAFQAAERAPLNARSKRVQFEGALIKVGAGFGCIHPWPELGDAPLDQQLQALAEGKETPLIRRALHCCEIDGTARKRGENLFSDLSIPQSHYTLPPHSQDVPDGFSIVKIKGGAIGPTAERIRKLSPELGVRVDFNEALSPDELRDFWTLLDVRRECINLLEDPTPFEESTWRELSSSLQCEFAVDRAVEQPSTAARIRVVKPARNDPAEQAALADLHHQALMFTSYMDHPLGQMFAAYEAALVQKRRPQRFLECGLVTHHLFDDSDPFVSALGPPIPQLQPVAGTGLGFDDLLNDLPWIPLTNTTSSC